MAFRSYSVYLLVSAVVLASSSPATSQDPTSSALVTIRCETFCSKSSLRTVSARLTWVDPSLRPGGAPVGFDAGGAAPPNPPQLDVSVVRNGFNANAYATLPTTGTVGASPATTFNGPASPVASSRAYDLRVVGIVRPVIAGAFSLDDAAPSIERRETSLVIENLEPGLRYSWRLRFNTPAGERTSATAVCFAPACPADMKE
jgi:hypothetical protein